VKQIFQDMAKGGTVVVKSPSPCRTYGHLVVRTTSSLISAGTERMLAAFGRASYLDKARQQPEKVKMVF